jgi:PAS domain S-box-containing protein
MQQRSEQIRVLEALVRAVAAALEPRVVHDQALDALHLAIGVSRASILLFDAGGVMRFQAWRGLSDAYRARVEGHSPWTPDSSDAQPILVEDVSQAAGLASFLPAFEAERIAALAFIPLITRGRIVGQFMLYYDAPRAFPADEVAFAVTVAHYIAFTIDRLQAEQAAVASADRLRFALGAAAMGTWEWHIATNQLECSPTLRAMHGVDNVEADITFDRFTRDIHPEDRDRVLSALDTSLHGGADHQIEYRIVLADGSVKWVEGKGRLMRDERGTPRRMIGICTDISARKRLDAERFRLLEELDTARRRADFRAKVTGALASSLEYDTILPQVARLMVPFFADWCTVDLLDEAGQLRRGAAAHRDPEGEAELVALRERYPDMARSAPPHDVLATGQPMLLVDISLDGLREAAVSDDYYERVRALAPASSIVLPLRTPGRVLGVMTFVFARSGRRYSDADLSLAQDLAQSAAIAIENARLFRELQEANRMKDEFLATLSHELRTPLNAILGWSSMLSSRPIDDSLTARGLAAIDRNARAQTKLINDLLDVSRIVSGKLQVARASVDLLKVVDTAIDAVRLSCASKHITLEPPSVGALPRVVGDPDRLQQIIWNLLSNAVKFTPEGGRIAVNAGFDGAAVEVAVSDNGLGISPHFLPHVFDRFRQADASTTRMYSGLGLGLSIVRQLTELHGGTVRAESAGPGMGATFTVRFPASRGTPDEPVPEPAERPSAELRDVRVLIVDDDADARDFVQICLQRAGAGVLAAASAAEAAAHLMQPLDILITDIAMPEEDGYTLLARARAIRPALPAIAFTAHAMPEDEQRMSSAGFDRHLVKPAEARRLIDAVSALVGIRKA